MALSWNEIRERAIAFSKKWADATDENAEAKPLRIYLQEYREGPCP